MWGVRSVVKERGKHQNSGKLTERNQKRERKKKQNAIKLLLRLFIRNSEDNNKVFL